MWRFFKVPRSTREWAKRKLKEAVDNLNWGGYHVIEVATRYSEDHPEISEPLETIATVIEQLMETIQKVRGSF